MDDLELLNEIEPVSKRMLAIYRHEQQAPQIPSLASRTISYSKDVAGFIASGFKTRTDEEVDIIWNICKKCESLVDGICVECWCPISKDGVPMRNKLKMANTRCGKGLW